MKLSFVLQLLVLGAAGNVSIATAQSAGTFSATGDMTTPRMGHSATLLNNGRVLIAGGYQNVPGGQHCEGQLHTPYFFLDCVSRVTSAELYDPFTGTFSPTGSMTGAGLHHTATLLPNGKIFINWGSSAELYDPSSGTFTAIDRMAPGGGTATLLTNGKVLFTGLPATLYDLADGTFAATGGYAGTPGNLGSATLLPDGHVLITGDVGCCYDVGQTEIYDPGSGTFSLTAAVFTGAPFFIATLLPTGKVLAAGAGDANDDNFNPIDAGLYDAASGTFLRIGSMTMARQDQTATPLPNGTVFIAGGDFASGSSTEVLRPGRRTILRNRQHAESSLFAHRHAASKWQGIDRWGTALFDYHRLYRRTLYAALIDPLPGVVLALGRRTGPGRDPACRDLPDCLSRQPGTSGRGSGRLLHGSSGWKLNPAASYDRRTVGGSAVVRQKSGICRTQPDQRKRPSGRRPGGRRSGAHHISEPAKQRSHHRCPVRSRDR